jgi:hypothetical protein
LKTRNARHRLFWEVYKCQKDFIEKTINDNTGYFGPEIYAVETTL